MLNLHAQQNTNQNPFQQITPILPTPNEYRTASGAPGHAYWQNQADYDLYIELDDAKRYIYGTATITYTNNSPDALAYLWVQLDQNEKKNNGFAQQIRSTDITPKMSFDELQKLMAFQQFEGGFRIEYVKDAGDKSLSYTINETMMRIDLPQPLLPGTSISFKTKWWYPINDRMLLGGRSGYEYFPIDDNCLYTIAQFYPRMAVYSDNKGWQNQQFTGASEFALPFGNYQMHLTLPADMVVAATGTLQNPDETLTDNQKQRWEKAQKSNQPVFIITEQEAKQNEKSRKKDKKTWFFKADTVRDFAFAASRKFIWDAMAVPLDGKTVMAMSFYPKEGNPLWEKYSTKAVAHTLRTYSKYTFAYPYPVAISVHAQDIGMEYPMICFNFGRPETDGTYSDQTKYRMLGVIIHEVGHNYFPMIINSDEREWTWMDEGLNSFLQYLTEQEWERSYPSRRGPAYKIVDYMKSDKSVQAPIMSNIEAISTQLGNNAYGKPAAALNILRETVMGRELFDFAFKTYANRWKFKHPTPADFFRTMEDASGVDLDWFWRGWFYTTDHVDIAIDNVIWYKLNTKNPEIEKPLEEREKNSQLTYITDKRNEEEALEREIDQDPSLRDFYNLYNPFQITLLDRKEYDDYLAKLENKDKDLLKQTYNFYDVTFSNKGGLVMPLVVMLEFADDTQQIFRIPAQIWGGNAKYTSKVFMTQKEVKQIILDPYLETADIEMSNNYYPAQMQKSRFELFKQRKENPENPMQRDRRAK